MAISADLRVSATLSSYPTHSVRRSLPPTKVKLVLKAHRGTRRKSSTLFEFKVQGVGFSSLFAGGSGNSEVVLKWPRLEILGRNVQCHCHRSLTYGITGDNKISPESVDQETESFLLSAINMSFFERLNLAWKILFPPPATRRSSNARIAKQRLKMILFSDRCAVSDEAKQKIVSNIVGALSDFVEIESRDKVQLSVSTDPDLGTVYSVTVPVRRVKPDYQYDDEFGAITSIEYKDTGESSGSVDVKFDFFIPNDKM